MTTKQAIRGWCEEVGREFQPDRIILFGSHARGAATPDSDVDILVVMPVPRGADARQAAAIRDRVRASFPMDVIVRSPREIGRRIARRDGFITGILRHGVVMYEALHARVDR